MIRYLKLFWAWLIYIPGYPEPPVVAPVAKIVVRPVVLNPKTVQEVEFAKWRIGHITRWLDHSENASHTNREYLTEEREMHITALANIGVAP